MGGFFASFGPAGVVTGIIRWGEPPEPIGQSRAATRPQPAELRQAEMGGRKGLGYPSEPDLSDSEVYRSRPGHPRQIRPERPGSSQRQRGVLRACEPSGALTRC